MSEKQILDEMSRAIAEEIDFEIISDLLVSGCGWTEVILDPDLNEKAMIKWCQEQCEKKTRFRGKTWLFERQADAALFKLTWS